jgi:hypothetical protein
MNAAVIVGGDSEPGKFGYQILILGRVVEIVVYKEMYTWICIYI